MKLLMIIILINLSLSATINTSTNKNVLEIFREQVSDSNAIIKRGEYDRIALNSSDRKNLLQKIEELDIESKNIKRLRNDILSYSKILNAIIDNLQQKAPDLQQHYQSNIKDLKKFNLRINSIGLYQLSTEWLELSRIKHSFVKKPSNALERKFNDKWNSVVITITELYLDEEMEEPMFEYLNHYKAYFTQLNLAYKSAEYSNVAKLKHLSYKIKAQLEQYKYL